MAIPEHGPYRRELLRIGPQDSGHHPWKPPMDDVGERDFWAKIIISGFLDDFCSSPKMVYSFGGFNQSGNSKENLWKIYIYEKFWRKKLLTDGLFMVSYIDHNVTRIFLRSILKNS